MKEILFTTNTARFMNNAQRISWIGLLRLSKA